MNKINFFLLILIAVGVVCGCKYNYNLSGETNNSNRNSRRSNDRGDQPKMVDDKKSRRAKSDGSDDEADDSVESSDSHRKSNVVNGDISRLSGKWVWSRTGSTTYTDSGSYAGGNGSHFTYEFSDDGAVQFVGIMNVIQGGCSQQITTIKNGQATLDGNNLTIEWAPADFTRDFSCDTANNYEKNLPASTETSTIAFKNSSGQEQLCMTDKEETCFSPAE